MNNTVETEKSLQVTIIIGPGHPIKKFSNQFARNLQETLVTAIYSVENGPIPVFDKFELSRKKNSIRVTCVNRYSEEWLIDAVKKLSPFEETPLLVVKEKTAPKLRLFYMFVPYSATPNTNVLLTRIKRSTPNLEIDFWKIRRTKAVAKGTAVSVEIDTFSIGLIEERKYAVRLGMGWVYFWDHENNKGHQAAEFLAVTRDDTSVATVQPSSKMGETTVESSGSLKMAIISKGEISAPTSEFTHQFAERLQYVLNINGIEVDPVPVFSEIGVSNQKYIRVTCDNEISKRWLIDGVRKLSPFQGMFLLAVEEENVPKLRDFYVYYPYLASRNTNDILNRIKTYSPLLKTEFWKIRNSKLVSNGTALRIEIDTFSIRLIEEMGYEVYVGMDRAYFWDEENKKGHFQVKLLRNQRRQGYMKLFFITIIFIVFYYIVYA